MHRRGMPSKEGLNSTFFRMEDLVALLLFSILLIRSLESRPCLRKFKNGIPQSFTSSVAIWTLQAPSDIDSNNVFGRGVNNFVLILLCGVPPLRPKEKLSSTRWTLSTWISSSFWSWQQLNRKNTSLFKKIFFVLWFFKFSVNHTILKVVNYVGLTINLDTKKRPRRK